MIPRCRLLSSIWKRTLPQLSRNSHAACLVERVFSLSSNVNRCYPDYDSMPSNTTVNKLALGKCEPDHLREAILRSTTLEDIFEVIENHASIMGEDHLRLCLLKLANMVSRGIPIQSVKNHPAFRNWMDAACHRVSESCGTNQVWLLSSLNALEVEANEEIIEKICINLRFNLPDVKFYRLLSLHSLLGKFGKPRPALYILSKVVPALIQARIEAELDENDTEMCSRAFNFILVSGIGGATRDLAAEAALKQCRKFSLISAYRALLASRAHKKAYLNFDGTSNKIREVLRVCADTVADGMDEFPDKELQKLLSLRRSWCVGSDRFFEGLWKRASGWDSTEKGALVGASVRVGYMTLPLADSIVEWFLENHEKLSSDPKSIVDLTQIATVLATSAVHNDRGTDAHERAVRAANCLLDFVATQGNALDISSLTLSYLLVQICCCGIYPQHFLDKLFGESCQEEFSMAAFPLENLLKLEELAGHDLGNSLAYTIQPEHRARSRRSSDPCPNRLFDILAEELGGSQFLERNVEVARCSVEMLFAMDKNGTPVEIPGKLQNSVNLEALPTNTRVVAILLGGKTQFSSGLLRPFYARKAQWLRDENFCPVMIDLLEMKGTPLETWKDRLMGQIKQAVRGGAMYR